MGLSSILLKDKLLFSLNQEDQVAIRKLFEQIEGCGLVKLSFDPTLCSPEILKEKIHDNDAVILYNNEIYYAHHNTLSVTKIDLTDINQDDIQQLLKKFTDDYKLANTAELQLIIAATGYSPLNSKISKDADAFLLEQKELFKHRLYLPALVAHETEKLNAINFASFLYMRQTERDELEKQLLFTFAILYAQFQLDATEHRLQNINAQTQQLHHCAKLINKLRQTPPTGSIKSPEQFVNEMIADGDMPAKYLGLTAVAPFIVEKMDELSSGKSTVIRQWMGEINGRRLYWVWAGNLLRTVIGLLPDELARKSQAQKAVTAPTPFCGYMSWILYYARFGIELGLLLKHTIAGPWMHEKESEIPAWERFKTQWKQRKYSLLNDSIWGTANLTCFFWLKGPGMLGYIGDAVTGLLLIMDSVAAAWQFCEARTQHKKEMLKFDNNADALHAQIMELVNKKDKDEKERQYLAYLRRQLDHLLREKNQYAFNWQYKKYSFINNLTYAIGLLSAFSLMCCFFFPPAAIAPTVALILGAVGAALCFVLTVAYSSVGTGIDVAKTRQSTKSTKEELKERLEAFKGLKPQHFDSEEEYLATKKQLYLDLKQLASTSIYQERSANYQKLHLIRKIITDALIPPLILASFIFLPMGLGVAAFAAGLVLAIAVNKIINSFEPKADKLPVMDDEEEKKFLDFVEDPTLEKLTGKAPSVVQAKKGLFAESATNKAIDQTILLGENYLDAAETAC